MKRCPDCDESLPLAEFGKNRSTKDGYTAYCRRHHNLRGRVTLAALGGRRYRIRRRYGVDSADVDKLIEDQGGVCPLCLGPPEHVDHDWSTNNIRGVLCSQCNMGLGSFRDNPEALRRAADYVEGGGANLVPYLNGGGNKADSWGWKREGGQ